jgi:hypothetical protein
MALGIVFNEPHSPCPACLLHHFLAVKTSQPQYVNELALYKRACKDNIFFEGFEA